MSSLKEKKLFLLDMDGTIYIEDQLIPGAKEFLNAVLKKKSKYIFLTNNSSKSSDQYLEKLNSMQIVADESNIFTSGMATAIYILNNKLPREAYVVGTNSFKDQLKSYGIEVMDDHHNANLLIVGFDTELTYHKVVNACELIARNVLYIATNPDLTCPVSEGRYIPDCGSICNMLEAATNRTPIYMGKPRKEMVDILSKREMVDLQDIVIVGDRLYTDIACGINAGITSVAVLTGETNANDIVNSQFKPDFVFNSIFDLCYEIQ